MIIIVITTRQLYSYPGAGPPGPGHGHDAPGPPRPGAGHDDADSSVSVG